MIEYKLYRLAVRVDDCAPANGLHRYRYTCTFAAIEFVMAV
jgi:hypothetical protein